MKNEEWINTFINKFNESKDYKITDVRDREKLLDELRPTGKWEQDINGWHVCTNCHMQYRGMPTIDRKPRWQYCPTCGAKMEKEDSKND